MTVTGTDRSGIPIPEFYQQEHIMVTRSANEQDQGILQGNPFVFIPYNK